MSGIIHWWPVLLLTITVFYYYCIFWRLLCNHSVNQSLFCLQWLVICILLPILHWLFHCVTDDAVTFLSDCWCYIVHLLTFSFLLMLCWYFVVVETFCSLHWCLLSWLWLLCLKCSWLWPLHIILILCKWLYSFPTVIW